MTKEAVHGEIEFIPGNTKVLLVAPRNHDENDKNTEKPARLIAEQLG